MTTAGGATGRAMAPAGASRAGARRSTCATAGRPLRRARRAPGGGQRERADRAGARRLRRRRPGRRRRGCSIDLDGHASATGGNARRQRRGRDLDCGRRAPAAAVRPRRCRCGGAAGASGGRFACPLPEIQIFGGGAHAARRVDVQDFMVVCPAAPSFAEALDWTAEVYRAAGALLAERGGSPAWPTRAGWWPAFDRNEEALEAALASRRSSAAGFAPGDDVGDLAGRRRLRARRRRPLPPRRSTAPARHAAAWSSMLVGWIGRYPIRLGRGSARRGRPCRPGERSPPRSARRSRSSATTTWSRDAERVGGGRRERWVDTRC